MQNYNLDDDNNQVIHVVNYDEPSPPRESQNEKDDSAPEDDDNIEIMSQDSPKLNVIEIEPEFPDRLITADNR